MKYTVQVTLVDGTRVYGHGDTLQKALEDLNQGLIASRQVLEAQGESITQAFESLRKVYS